MGSSNVFHSLFLGLVVVELVDNCKFELKKTTNTHNLDFIFLNEESLTYPNHRTNVKKGILADCVTIYMY